MMERQAKIDRIMELIGDSAAGRANALKLSNGELDDWLASLEKEVAEVKSEIRQAIGNRQRELLPSRRASENITIESNGVYMTVTVGRYPDGRPGESFVSDIKAGTVADALLRDCAIILSIALQYGTPVETIAGAITRNPDGTNASFMGALVDHLAKEDKS